MATPALIVVISVAVLSLLVLSVTVLFLLQHVKRLTGSLREVKETLQPRLDALAADTEVTQRELERIADATDRMGASDDR